VLFCARRGGGPAGAPPVEASELLVVHVRSLAAERDKQAPVAEPAALGGKLAQPGAQDRIVGTDAAIAHRGPIRSDHMARPALAHLVRPAEMSHSLPLHDGVTIFLN
jgi:hypothetical protein